MPNMHQQMKLSHDEEIFLRHWMYDEFHFLQGGGAAKRLQLSEKVTPADLAVLIAAAFPDLAEQEAAGHGPPPTSPLEWPWTAYTFPMRLAEARSILAERQSSNPIANYSHPEMVSAPGR